MSVEPYARRARASRRVTANAGTHTAFRAGYTSHHHASRDRHPPHPRNARDKQSKKRRHVPRRRAARAIARGRRHREMRRRQPVASKCAARGLRRAESSRGVHRHIRLRIRSACPSFSYLSLSPSTWPHSLHSTYTSSYTIRVSEFFISLSLPIHVPPFVTQHIHVFVYDPRVRVFHTYLSLPIHVPPVVCPRIYSNAYVPLPHASFINLRTTGMYPSPRPAIARPPTTRIVDENRHARDSRAHRRRRSSSNTAS